MGKYSFDQTKIKELLKDPEVVDMFDRYIPGVKDNIDSMGPCLNMSLKVMTKFPQAKLTPEKIAAWREELDAYEG